MMGISNAQKSAYNILTSVLGQVITIVLGVVIPRLVLVNLGSENNGLLSSITQVLGYASLLEAGVGLASLQALYKPVAEHDETSVNAIMSATNLYYRRTGIAYLLTVIILSAIYPVIIKSSLPYGTITIVVLISGLPGVVNYYFQGKYKILLQAEGRTYIITNLATVIGILTSVGKILLLLLGFGVIAVQSLYLALSLVQMIYIDFYIRKNYAWIDLTAAPAYDKLSQRNSVLAHQLSGTIFSSTDAVTLSIFCGLSVVSVYSMYALLFGMVGTLLSNLAGSITFVLGQELGINQKKYGKLQDSFELVYISLSFSLFFIAYTYILPFLKIYTAGITDINYIDRALSVLFVAIALLENSRLSSAKAIHVAGHFRQTQWHAWVEMAINIIVSLIGVLVWGVYGVLIGTIAALLFRANAMIIYANKKILHRSPWKTYRRWLVNLALFIAVTVLSKPLFARIALDTYPRIILWAAITSVVVIPLFFVVASMFDRETYRYAKTLVVPYLKQARDKLKGRSRTQD